MQKFALQYVGRDGKTKWAEVDVTMYKKAAEKGLTIRQYVADMLEANAKEADRPNYDYGHPMDQAYATSGLVTDKRLGAKPMTLADIASGTLAAGTSLRAPDGNDTSLASRLLFPQLLLETMEAELRDDGSDIIAKYNELVSVQRNIAGTRVDQPLVNTQKQGEGPDGSRSRRQAQMAEPATMVNITVGERSYRIPTFAIGLTISDEALEATTIDLVRVIMETQARGERIAMIEEQLHDMIFGNVDRNMTALPVKKISAYDSSINENGKITKRAYIKWLRENYRIRNISHVLTDLDTVLDIDEQLMPKMTGQDSSKIATPFAGFDTGITLPKIVDFDTEVFGANTLVGVDRRNAIQRFVNITADYSAIEEYVMRKATSFRVDFGEMSTRLYDEAWSVVQLQA